MRKGVVVLVMVAAGFIAGQAQGQNLTCTGTVFNDVNSVTQPSFCGWIEWFSDLGITSGCSVNPPLFCPNSFVTRAQMAVFVGKAMRGGHDNSVTNDTDTVGGGISNTASGGYSTVGGGGGNTASGTGSTVGGGNSNTASGLGSTVGGGVNNTASGKYSFAAGRSAKAVYDGCFVWGDSTDAEVNCFAPNRLVARASGGVNFYTSGNMLSGVRVASGGSAWLAISDRDSKENFAEVNGKEILNRLSRIPIQTWNWKTQEPTIRHMGPVSQDFYTAFRVGEDDKHISTVDADGVALAAIQGLYQVVKEKDAAIAEQDTQLRQQDARIRQLETANRQMEAALAEVLKRVAAMEKPTNTIAQK